MKNKKTDLVPYDAQALAKAEKQAKAAVLAAKDFKIDSGEEAILAKEALLYAKGELKKWEEEKALIVKPLNEGIKNARKFFATLLDNWEEAERLLKTQISAWQTKRELEQRKEHEALLLKARKQNVVADFQALAIKNAHEESEQVRGISFSERWYAEVVSMELLPEKYKLPDQQRLDAMARAAKSDSNIPGVVFKCEKTVRAAV